MYQGKAFSPTAALLNNIGASDTIIMVSDISVFPPAPNLATIGIDETAETILYTAIAGNALSGCSRGIEGTAKAWNSETIIARNFTAADYEALIANILAMVEADLEGNANQIVFEDGQTFQQKLITGTLKGPQGNPGTTGADGNTLLIGNIAPASGVGKIGDVHINYVSWDVNEKTTSTTWTIRGNIKGATGAAGANGKNLEFLWNGTQLGVRQEGGGSYQYVDLVGPQGGTGANGTNGKNPELQASATHIQWRWVGDLSWINLKLLSELQGAIGPAGAAGKTLELQKTATHIQWKVVDDPTWTNLVALVDITGPQGQTGGTGPQGNPGGTGPAGPSIELQKASTHVQWRVTGGAWADLVALSEITGAAGSQGSPGATGPAGGAGPAGTSVTAILASNETTAISLSISNPNNIYYWV